MADCPEIQDSYSIPKAGDFIKLKSGIEIVRDYHYELDHLIVDCADDNFLLSYTKDKFTWLPQQSDL